MMGLFGQGSSQGGGRGPVTSPSGAAPQETASSLIKDGTTASFGADVLAESARQPVLVDFWAPWYGPCKQLTPILEKVVRAAGGKVKLVKMNIDEHPEIPGRLGVRSIPAVFAFQRGQPVDGFLGALPEKEVTGFIERLVGPLSDTADRLAAAEALAASGDTLGAAQLYKAILAESPGEPGAVAGLARLLISAGELDSARAILESAGAAGDRDQAILAAKAALDLAQQAAGAGDPFELKRRLVVNPDDHEARFDLAVLLNSQNLREEAASELIEIIKRNRAWNDDGARKQLLQFFEAWGSTDKATIAARRKLSALLFS